MALAFLSKKSWHTSNLKNIEKVWIAEQKHEQEQKKLEELKKEIKEEKQMEELRELKNKSGNNNNNNNERLDWMYDKMINEKIISDEYLLGKEYINKSNHSLNSNLENVLKLPIINNNNYNNMNNNKPSEIFSRLNEDPMMIIKKKQKNIQDSILKNPVKMKRLKEKLKLNIFTHKKKDKKDKKDRKSKRVKKDKKDKKDKNDKEKIKINNNIIMDEHINKNKIEQRNKNRNNHRSRSRSKFRIKSRNRSRSRNQNRHRSRSRTRSQSRSRIRYKSKKDDGLRHQRKDSYSSRSRSPTDRSRKNVSNRNNYNHENNHEKEKKEKKEMSRSISRNTKYGLTKTDRALKCDVIDSTSLGPSQDYLEKAKTKKRKEKEEINKKKYGQSNNIKQTPYEKEKKLIEMMQNADQREEWSHKEKSKILISEQNHSQKKEKKIHPVFLNKINKDAYDGNDDKVNRMEERIRRNMHYIQKNVDSTNFL